MNIKSRDIRMISNGLPALMAERESGVTTAAIHNECKLTGVEKNIVTNILAVANHVGGVGKTTTALSLAGAFVQQDLDVLLVDLDPRAGLSQLLGLVPVPKRMSIADIYLGTESIYRLSRQTRIPRLDLIPSGPAMEMAERFLQYRKNYRQLLRQAFDGESLLLQGMDGAVEKHMLVYDVVILDCPAAEKAITITAMMAAQLLILPTLADAGAVDGIRSTLEQVNQVRWGGNQGLHYRILTNRVNAEQQQSGGYLEEIHSVFQDNIFKQVIDSDDALSESQVVHLPITHYNPQSPSAQQYQRLAQELLPLLSSGVTGTPLPGFEWDRLPPTVTQTAEPLADPDFALPIEIRISHTGEVTMAEAATAVEVQTAEVITTSLSEAALSTVDSAPAPLQLPAVGITAVSAPPVISKPDLTLIEKLAERLRNAKPGHVALFYLGLLTIAELLVTFIDPRVGLALHGFILVSIILHASFIRKGMMGRFLFSMTMAPLIRLMSLSLPLVKFPPVFWYAVVGLPLLLAAFFSIRICQVNFAMIGISRRKLFSQLLIGITGIGLGALEYLILRPNPLVDSFRIELIIIPALILLVFTGFLEELIFRGVMQYTALINFGWKGLIYTSLVFAVLHIGYRSLLDVFFVFAVALMFGYFSLKTHSIIGVTIAHGLTNIGLFLVFPFLMG